MSPEVRQVPDVRRGQTCFAVRGSARIEGPFGYGLVADRRLLARKRIRRLCDVGFAQPSDDPTNTGASARGAKRLPARDATEHLRRPRRAPSVVLPVLVPGVSLPPQDGYRTRQLQFAAAPSRSLAGGCGAGGHRRVCRSSSGDTAALTDL